MIAKQKDLGATSEAGSHREMRRILCHIQTAIRVAGLVALVTVVFPSTPAFAVDGGPQWTVTSVSRPTNFAPDSGMGVNSYVAIITNTGGASSDGSPVTIVDELPSGLSLDPLSASGEDRLSETDGSPGSAKFKCAVNACTYSGTVVPDDTLIVKFSVDVLPGAAPTEMNVVRVSGGGAPDASITTPTTISPSPAGFGISPGGATTSLSTTQAGAHPDLTASLAFNTVNAKGSLAGDPKDTTYDLPPGFAGDLVDTPTCPDAQFLQTECPVGTQVGVISLTVFGGEAFTEPVYNLAPNPGQLAKLGFVVADIFFFEGNVSLDPRDYSLTTTFADANQSLNELDNVSLTLWGVPADPIHDPLRMNNGAGARNASFGATVEPPKAPFFTNPTSCTEAPFHATISADSWEEPANVVEAEMPFGPIVGCDRLSMQPRVTTQLTTPFAYSPTGLDLEMGIPQTYNNPGGLATSTLSRAVISLPEGVTVNPSAGSGLEACSEAQYDEESVEAQPGRGCPNGSKLGTVKAASPAVAEEASGSVFLGAPIYKSNGQLILRLYLVMRIPSRGVIVRAEGNVVPNELTGQLVSVFENIPPLPFNLLTFSFRQGQTSPLVSPSACGEYTVRAELTPSSAPLELLTPEIPPMQITNGFDGGACPTGGAPPFHPQVVAGTLDNNAGAYSPLFVNIVRDDGEQEITGFSSQLPAGLTANLTGVPFCPEADIALSKTKTGAQEEEDPSCPKASEIGHTLVGAGVGSVLVDAPGKLYLGGPYDGSPFSVVAITSAKVGPFDLGTVVVHLPLQVDQETAAVSVAVGGDDQIPHIVKGIVVHVRDIKVYVDRPDFVLNPTNCSHMNLMFTVVGSGANFTSAADDDPVNVTDPFEAANCQSLSFKPSFTVSTSAKTSRADGASLTARLAYPNMPQGSQANIQSVKVDLPRQLPSRLSTLQKACTASTFDANPGACPAASIVGHARAVTPLLPVPLVGPAYFVSNGGARFPELVIVLQGYGVTISLHGETFISKLGITSSTFRTIPDEAVGSFELTLPEGRDSALAANGDLCKTKLLMPTAFTAQNGIVLHRSTPIAVTGCPKPKRRAAKKIHRTKKAHRS